ncbi:MAG: amidohydrolase family protein [Hamadaea sp.]|nr:amidohydrolase family protein [Hamadaea sp.]
MLDSVAALPLTDHHCHGVVQRDLAAPGFAALLTEAGPGASGEGLWDSRLGFAVRRWCAPVLDLPAHAPAADYLDRRASLGHAEVTRRLLAAAGLGALLVDEGYAPEPLTPPAELAQAAGAAAYPVVRLETVAEQVLVDGTDAAGFPDAFRERLAAAVPDAIAVKSIAAYRTGLNLAPQRPADREVIAAAGLALAGIGLGGRARVADETLQRFLIWSATDLGAPIQFHCGYGDRDLDLAAANPLLLTPLLRALEPAGVPVLLLHNYPFHREAGYLAQVFPDVYFDVGLATHNVGARATQVLTEATELAPFGKLLYSSDAYGLAEHYHLGALLFRRALTGLLRDGIDGGAWTEPDADRIARMVGVDNAARVYRLP